jgi:Alfin
VLLFVVALSFFSMANFKNTIINTYLHSQRVFLDKLLDVSNIFDSYTQWHETIFNDNEITGVLPGLIQIPNPTAHKLDDFPNINYQPTVQERYQWTLELARRLDAWLAAIIAYATITYSQEDRLNTLSVINRIDTLVNKSTYWLCSQDECILDWQS